MRVQILLTAVDGHIVLMRARCRRFKTAKGPLLWVNRAAGVGRGQRGVPQVHVLVQLHGLVVRWAAVDVVLLDDLRYLGGWRGEPGPYRCIISSKHLQAGGGGGAYLTPVDDLRRTLLELYVRVLRRLLVAGFNACRRYSIILP